MENQRTPFVPWPKSFAYVQLSSFTGLMSIICVINSADAYVARIAFGSFLISSVVLAVSLRNFRNEIKNQNICKKESS